MHYQGLLEAQLHNIFPGQRIIKNQRKLDAIKNPRTGANLEVDVWLPDAHLCFEFQDDYHYRPAWYSQLPLSLVQQKDSIKRSEVLNMFQTLIVVPYWWDTLESSLKGTIRFHRPDLKLQQSLEIPANPPQFSEKKQLMLASFPEHINLALNAWWVGEKWDGIRCFWNSTKRKLYTRQNIKLNLHPASKELFGQAVLDGEIWCGRGFFIDSQKFAASSWNNFDRSFVKLVCFDEASVSAQNHPFEVRYALLLSHVSSDNPGTIVAPRFLSNSEANLLEMLQNIIDSGGEGLILRKPLSLYLPGRSDSLLKIKASYSDQEGLVVRVKDDGSLLMQQPNGYFFEVPREDVMLPQQPVKGDIVTFSFDFAQRFTSLQQSVKDYMHNRPSNPIVHRIRYDISWEDVAAKPPLPVRKFGNEAHQAFKAINQSTTEHISTAQIWKPVSNRRKYFDDFAASKGGDPLSPDFWYTVITPELLKFNEGYTAIAHYYGRKLSSTLMNIYPDIGLVQEKFKVLQSWKNENDRREYFDAFAASRGKDPLVPSFWYNVTIRELQTFNHSFKAVVNHHGGKLSTTLMELYPNIGLKQSNFAQTGWRNENTRREYFAKFAVSQGMDHLNPIFWYGVTAKQLKDFHSGYWAVVEYYEGRFTNALLQLYPTIGLKKHLFASDSRDFASESSRRAFFDKFAASQGKDPLKSSFWYKVTTPELKKYHRGYVAVLNYYGGKLSTTLLKLYPNIGLKQKYLRANTKAWGHENTRRMYFDKFAAAKGMDPLNPVFWYNVTTKELKKYNKGYWTIIVNYYGGKLSTTLMQLYPNIGLQKHKLYWK